MSLGSILLITVGYFIMGIVVALLVMMLKDETDFDPVRVGLYVLFWPYPIVIVTAFYVGKFMIFLFINIILGIGSIFFRDR